MKKQQTESIPESINRHLTWLLRVLVSISIILVLAVMPFYFQEGFTHIGSDKSYFYRVGTVRMSRLILPVFGLWLVCNAVNAFLKRPKGMLREWAKTLSITDWFALFYGLSAFLSYVCSQYKGKGFWDPDGTAFWGTRGWYMGFIPQLTLVVIYFLVSRFQFKDMAKWLFRLSLPVSAAVFLLGYLNRFDIWPIPMANSGLPGFISTIGNINWYCGYAVAIGFVGVGLLWLERGENKWYTALLCAYVFIFFATLITQGSDSGVFALGVVFLVMFFSSVKDEDGQRMYRFWLLVMLLMGAGLATMGLRLLLPGRMTFTSWVGDLLTYSLLPLLGMLPAGVGLLLGRQFCGKHGRLSDGKDSGQPGGRGGEQPDGKDSGQPGEESRGGRPKIQDMYWKAWRAASKTLCIAILITVVIFTTMIAVNTLHPGSLGALSQKAVFTFNDKWGSSRGASWSLGAECFWEQDLLHKLLGVGPDCMADFLYSESGGGKVASEPLVAHARKAFVNKRLTNAHCELLTILVNLGILGLVSFAGLLFTAVGRFLRARGTNCYVAACGLCVLAYIANNVWSFQQSMSLATIAVVLGMGEWFLRISEKL